MEERAKRYVILSHGRIVAVLIIELEYPRFRWATVSLLVAGDASRQEEPRWALRNAIFYYECLDDDDDDNGQQQPTG